MLFECLTGSLVYNAPNLSALLAFHLRDAPPDPATLNPEVSATLSGIILKALARDPKDRWQSASEMLRSLEEA